LTPYLDIYQRVNIARTIRGLAKQKNVLVVEHDLAILDLLADIVYIAFGEPGAYGVITNPKGVRVGINEYLKGIFEKRMFESEPIRSNLNSTHRASTRMCASWRTSNG